MAFSNKQIKRLTSHMGGWYLDNATVTAIFDRLSKAEKYIKDHPCQDSGCLSFIAWRRACGKDVGNE